MYVCVSVSAQDEELQRQQRDAAATGHSERLQAIETDIRETEANLRSLSAEIASLTKRAQEHTKLSLKRQDAEAKEAELRALYDLSIGLTCQRLTELSVCCPVCHGSEKRSCRC